MDPNRSGTQGVEGDHGSPRAENGFGELMNFVEGRAAPMDDMMQDDEGHIGIDDSDDSDESYQPDTPRNEEGTRSLAISAEISANATLSDSTSNLIVGNGINSERASDLLLVVSLSAESTRTKILEHAYSAMEELAKIAVAGKPLWQPQKVEKYETLNDIEYIREFGNVDATLQEIIKMVEVGEHLCLPSFDSYQIEDELASKSTPSEALQIEASRDIAYVKMIPIDLVEMLMDLKQWSGVFHNIVSRAMILGILTNEVEGSFDGKLQVMSAEFHLPTPLVPTRECYFARYCKHLSDTTWGVVDVSLEKFFPSPSNNFRRRPSGCLIEEMPDGYSKVTWVEHVEADYEDLHIHFRQLVTSGFAFGATRWVASIVRQYEWSQTLEARGIPNGDSGTVIIPEAGRASVLKLAERMMKSFCVDISASSENLWMPLPLSSGSEDMKIVIKNSIDDPGKPPGTTVIFATSIWLATSPRRVFNFLRDENSRDEWDLLSRGLSIREFAYVIEGSDAANRISIMQVKNDEDKVVVHYLQESHTDFSGSYVIYAPLDVGALNALLNGGNPETVAILPSGFAILPDGTPKDNGEGSGTGSLLTIGFHIVDNASNRTYIPAESASTINKIISETVTAIKDAVVYNDNQLEDWTID